MNEIPSYWFQALAAALVIATLIPTQAANRPSTPAVDWARASTRTWVCPGLLLPFECKEFRQLLNQARSPAERSAVEKDVALLVADRKRACRCTGPHR